MLHRSILVVAASTRYVTGGQKLKQGQESNIAKLVACWLAHVQRRRMTMPYDPVH